MGGFSTTPKKKQAFKAAKLGKMKKGGAKGAAKPFGGKGKGKGLKIPKGPKAKMGAGKKSKKVAPMIGNVLDQMGGGPELM